MGYNTVQCVLGRKNIIIWRNGNFAKYVGYPGLCLSLFLFAVYILQFLTDQGDVWHIDQI